MDVDIKAKDVIQFQRAGDVVESVAYVCERDGRTLTCRHYPSTTKAFCFTLIIGIDWIKLAMRNGKLVNSKGGEDKTTESAVSDSRNEAVGQKLPRVKLFYATGRKKIKDRKAPKR